MTRRIAGAILAAAGMLASVTLFADVLLRDQAGLEAALRGTRPCCVVDARAEKQRQAQPLTGSIPYRAGMPLGGSGSEPAVLVADNDTRGLEIARALVAGAKDRTVLVVKGGAPTWRALAAPDAATSMPKTFVIPSNTCQQDKPLQTLPFGKR